MEEMSGEQPISAEEVARILRVSPRWVMKSFRAHTNGDPHGVPGHFGKRPRDPVQFYWYEVEAWIEYWKAVQYAEVAEKGLIAAQARVRDTADDAEVAQRN